MKTFLLSLSLILLVSCAGSGNNSLTSAQVQKICLDKKRSAEGPTGALSLSTGSSGSTAGIKLNFHSDYLIGKDPNSVYLDCMFQLNSRIKNI